MSRRANPAVVGLFVIGAVVLVVAGIVLFGSGRFFRQTCTFVCYFTGNVNGLNLGAPVKFKGVEVGSVTKISIKFEQQAAGVRIPVLIELDEAKISHAGGTAKVSSDVILEAVHSGLRAQLETQSLVTGLLFVQLDFFPNTPAQLVAENGEIPEIPTVPTTLEQAQQAIKDIIARLDKVDFDKLVTSIENLVDSATGAARSFEQLAGSPEVKSAISSADKALTKVGDLADSLDREIGPLAKNFGATSERTRETLGELDTTLKQTRTIIQPYSPLAYELARSLQEFAAAARSVRLLADLLNRDPSALVRGRAIPEGED